MRGAGSRAAETSNAPDSTEVGPRAAPADAQANGCSRFFDPDDGQFDLSHFLEHPYAFLPIPIIVTEPAVGYGVGAVGMFIRPREQAGHEGWSRPDISAVGGLATERLRADGDSRVRLAEQYIHTDTRALLRDLVSRVASDVGRKRGL